MNKPLPWIAFGILLALLSGLAGAATLRWLAGPQLAAPNGAHAIEPARAASAPADPALAAALQQLALELAALRADLAGAGAARASSDASAALPPAQLEALLLRVANAIERSSGVASAQSFEAELALRPTGAATPATLHALQVAMANDYERLLLEHKFWSYQRLLQRYGTPDRITADGPTCTFIYEVEEGEQVGFKLYSGIVIDVWN
ncbi:MAG: hypothetical protein FJ299_06160 [Planctomycetes bacterium]|nr:hypothetical protein [Planctomycetota bacterium]